mgnify:CR=1 FL=1
MSLSNWLKGRSPSVEILDRNGVRSLHMGGQAIQSAMRLATPERLELHYTRAMMAVLVTLLLVFGAERISDYLRRRVLDGGKLA